MNNKYDSSKKFICKQLNVVILNDRTKQMLKNDAILKEVVKNISALKAIEELSTKDKTKILAYKYLDRVNVVVNPKQTFIDFELPNEAVDLIDDVKFMDSLAFNLFGMNLEDIKQASLDNSKKLPFESTTTSTAQSKSDNQSQTINTNQTAAVAGAAFANNSRNSSNNTYNYGNAADYKEGYINQVATQRLMNEISTGKVFIYNSKPKAVPIIKYSCAAFCFLIAALFLASIIFSMYLSVSKTEYWVFVNDRGVLIDNATAEGARKINIFTGIGGILNFLLPSVLALSYLLIGYSNLKGTKNNENLKYTMKIFLIVLLSFFGLFNLFTVVNGSVVFTQIESYWPPGKEPFVDINTQSNLDLYKAYSILSILISCLPTLGLAFIIPYLIFKPKLNVSLQMDLLQQYRDEARSKINQ